MDTKWAVIKAYSDKNKLSTLCHETNVWTDIKYISVIIFGLVSVQEIPHSLGLL